MQDTPRNARGGRPLRKVRFLKKNNVIEVENWKSYNKEVATSTLMEENLGCCQKFMKYLSGDEKSKTSATKFESKNHPPKKVVSI